MSLEHNKALWVPLATTTALLTALSLLFGAKGADIAVAYVLETIVVLVFSYMRLRNTQSVVTAEDIKTVEESKFNGSPPACADFVKQSEGQVLPLRIRKQVACRLTGIAAFGVFMVSVFIVVFALGGMLGPLTENKYLWISIFAGLLAQNIIFYFVWKHRGDHYTDTLTEEAAKPWKRFYTLLCLIPIITVMLAGFGTRRETPGGHTTDPPSWGNWCIIIAFAIATVAVEYAFAAYKEKQKDRENTVTPTDTTATANDAKPAGWYPVSDTTLQWWDGEQWTQWQHPRDKEN